MVATAPMRCLAELPNPIPIPRHRRGRGAAGRRYGSGTVAARLRSERGSTLVGLVMALVVLGGLAALVVPTLVGGDAGPGGLGVGRGLVPTVPGASPAGGRGPAVIDAASVAACRADVASLETSMATAQAVTGSYPASFAELAARGFVNEVPARPGFTFAPEMTAGSPTGRVTVNGRPAAEGCAASAPPAGRSLTARSLTYH